ncbi:MAG TPA: response regulator transcription factor [Candidatus Binatia bacterium]|jgi:DNA-binding NarL/FixJ family response regulator|nr:response regulator transcription factor [Candidatus Binatia bacterium]
MSKTENNPITVAVVEDDAQVRQSLADILRRGPGVVCVGEHGNAEEAVREIPRTKPKVALMDINLPGMSGVDCVRRLSELAPQTQVVMLTVYDNTEAIFKSLAAGAGGYLLKPIGAAQLLSAVRDVYAGGVPMTSDIARKVLQTFKEPAPSNGETENLSPREQEVLNFLAKGYLYKEIADQLTISYGSVHTYIERIFKKLHVRSRGQAVAKYLGA